MGWGKFWAQVTTRFWGKFRPLVFCKNRRGAFFGKNNRRRTSERIVSIFATDFQSNLTRGNQTVPSFLCPKQACSLAKTLRKHIGSFTNSLIYALELTERIAQLLEEKYRSDEAFADCFTVEIELRPGNQLFVFADSDSGLTFEKCQKISRYLESYLDTNLWLSDKYVLEVSSPGITRPLKFLRQYQKNVGRTVAVTLTDKSQQTGTLKAADEAKVALEQETVVLDGKKKKKALVEVEIPFEQIEKTVVKLAF